MMLDLRVLFGIMSATLGCATSSQATQIAPEQRNTASVDSAALAAQDSANSASLPAGFGTFHQDDISFHISSTGVMIRALPLDESIIRLLTPDSYRAMHDLKQSNLKAVAAAARRHSTSHVSIWYVSFYGVEPEARFAPMDLTVTSSGRDFRPDDVLPLTSGFGEQKLRQRETQSALYVFNGGIQLEHPVTVSYQSVSDDSWEQTLQAIERERALIRARASKPK